MKYAGMPMGMWILFWKSFRDRLVYRHWKERNSLRESEDTAL